MEFKVEVEGLEALAKATEHLKGRAKNEIEKALYASGKMVESTAKRSIAGSGGKKGGRFYKRGSVLHQASAPGEPPSTDTGRLVNSINTYATGKTTGLLEVIVTAGRGLVNYAAHLEFGTSKMAPRPFMFPALEANRHKIKERLAAGMRKALEDSKK